MVAQRMKDCLVVFCNIICPCRSRSPLRPHQAIGLPRSSQRMFSTFTGMIDTHTKTRFTVLFPAPQNAQSAVPESLTCSCGNSAEFFLHSEQGLYTARTVEYIKFCVLQYSFPSVRKVKVSVADFILLVESEICFILVSNWLICVALK